MMRRLYSLLMNLLTPYLVLRLWWKSRSLPAYKERISERFCCDKAHPIAVDVWVHAVSLGEVIAAIPLIDAMLEQKWTVLITTMTPTGAERVKTRFGNKVQHRFVPYDLAWVVRRFFKRVQPKVAVIMETELWPNLIHYAHKAQIPLLLANARLSERSLKGYLRLENLFKKILQRFTAVLAQSDADAQRFLRLGAYPVHVLGNIKFDLQPDTGDNPTFEQLRQVWGKERVVVIAASTHESEELQILTHLKSLQEAIPGVILLIAPRHPERFTKVYQMCVQQGFNTGLRSNSLAPTNEVVVLDCLGELLGWYSISDYAFVGGSFVPVGGHNVLEPIAMNIPVLSGNQIHNFQTICDELKQAHGIKLVNNADELMTTIIQLHSNQRQKEEMMANAKKVFAKNQGALVKHLQQIDLILTRM